MHVRDVLSNASYRQQINPFIFRSLADAVQKNQACAAEKYHRQLAFLSLGHSSLDEYYSSLYAGRVFCLEPAYFQHVLMNFSMQMLSVRRRTAPSDELFLMINSHSEWDVFAASLGGQNQVKIRCVSDDPQAGDRFRSLSSPYLQANPHHEVASIDFISSSEIQPTGAVPSYGCVCVFADDGESSKWPALLFHLRNLSKNGHMLFFGSASACADVNRHLVALSGYRAKSARNPDPYIDDASVLSSVVMIERSQHSSGQ